MSRECYLTGKKNLVVNSVTRRGKARAQGGVGRKVTGVTKRVQRANLLKKTIRETVDGKSTVKTVWLSANALRTLSRGPHKGIELL
ncbi:50S ribosomal protein L28 [Deinococcus xianganensis]|uniref:Large ribosomal subunit protein bL28 n=1 Tax=Deinococcus xianganensis TaxID=1507289 RepID=A0A6I4YM20_9DEIO|nr:50S ribosomal protein L28 [Deinococcus xianganensis]MXV20087.1 50S ribosomal protein L28 [Deinococcus xianganensis]